ncbi:MAG: NHL repeat-containing protein, partial [Candidatus Eisenbacteria bacterium]
VLVVSVLVASLGLGVTASRAARLEVVATFAPDSSGRGKLIEPSGVATDAFGRVYVTDASMHTLQRWDASGHWLDETGTLGDEDTRFRRPSGVTRLGSLGVAVLDLENRRITAYDLQLRLLGVLIRLDEESLEQRVGRIRPVALAADRGGALALADGDADRVLLFDFAGRFTKEVGGLGGRAGAFRDVVAMAMSPNGTLVVVEQRSNPKRRKGAPADTAVAKEAIARVQVLDATGAVLRTWPLSSHDPRAFACAVDDSGRVAVATDEGRTASLVVFDPHGQQLAQWMELMGPRAVAFAPDGSLLVVEVAPARMRRLRLVPGD